MRSFTTRFDRLHRVLLAALAFAVLGGQLALQTHLSGHDLAALEGPCDYALQAHQLTPLPAAAPSLSPDPARHAAPESPAAFAALDSAPLVERSRGPPSLLA